MKYKSFGRTGVQVSPLCLGCMNFGSSTNEKAAQAIVDSSIDAGINFIDTANAYNGGKSEELLGVSLKNNKKRDRIVLATKVHHPMDPNDPNSANIHRRHIIEQCNASLKRLKTDYIDLYQLHRPDPGIPIDESLRALDDLIRAGKIRYIGTSSFPSWQIIESLWVSKEYHLNRFISEQPPYNLLDRRIERELASMAMSYHIALITWSPSARGFLTGKYSKNKSMPNDSRFNTEKKYGGFFPEWIQDHLSDASFRILDVVQEIAKEKKCDPIHISIAWCLSRPFITSTLMGPRTTDQLSDYLKALTITITDEDEKRINEVSKPGEHVVSYYGAPLADFSPKKYHW
ncbi:MAG: aldo/keto reductase [Spirochaetes bacterium]|jgi:aryl-alcohol dehydrogenase-like predicted oxidoreductase|nr:aldo/keto reductase [Spirochaetota bacterium]